MLWVCLLYTGLVHTAAAIGFRPEDAIFVPGSIPMDTDYREVHAHGGGLLLQNSTFYWYGTTQKYPPGWISEGINLYSSKDLQNWKFEGRIFNDTQIKDAGFSHPYRIERPKILVNRKTGNFSMLFHLDTPSFELKSVGVATAGNITGPWHWKGSFKPDGLDSYDMTAWQDANGTGYLARSIENTYLGISKLHVNSSHTSGICATAPRAEAPAIFGPHKGRYFVIASHLTGWAANAPLMFATAGNKLCNGELQAVPLPAHGPGSETTYNSQPAYVFPLRLSNNQTLFIYMGDRWNYQGIGSVGRATYVWLPLVEKEDGGFELVYRSVWSPSDFIRKPQN